MGQDGHPYVPEARSPLTGESHLHKNPNWEPTRSAHRCPSAISPWVLWVSRIFPLKKILI